MDRLVRMDYERGKAVFARTIVGEDGEEYETEIERDLPPFETTKGMIRKVKYDDEGKTYETEEEIEIPVFSKDDKAHTGE